LYCGACVVDTAYATSAAIKGTPMMIHLRRRRIAR